MRRTRRNPAPVTQTEAFRRWFGDSKVVDERGEPLVVYHGTPDARGLFGADGSGKRGFRTSPTRGTVFFATDDQSTASSYANPHRAWDYQNAEPAVIPLYLSIQNPLVVDGKFQHWRGTEAMVEKARAGGHDGAIILNTIDHYATPSKKPRREDASTVYVFFSPTQAKSAMTAPVVARDLNNWYMPDRSGRTLDFTGPNDGTFDVDDPDLRSNPDGADDVHVRFVYGARRRRARGGGFAPVVTQHGPGGIAHEHGGWLAQGYDEDVALAVAKEHAEELASQYVGDWNIEIVSAEDEHIERQAERAAWQARHEEGRGNPMRQPADEPGFHFAVIEHQKPGAWKGRIILAAYTDDRMLAWIAAMPARLLGPFSTGSGARRDAFPELGDGYDNDADVVWTVAKAHAWESGWGPLMYEALLTFVAEKGYSGWITSDTMMTSAEARAVWRKFADRDDVEFRPGVGHNVNDAPIDAMRALPSLLHARADLLKNADKRANYKRLVKLFLKDRRRADESGRFL